MKTTQPQLTQIVRAAADHAFALAALQLQANREQGRPGEHGYLDRFADAWLATTQHRPAWLAISLDGRPVGCLILHVIDGLPRPGRAPRPRVLISDTYVVADARGTGLGECRMGAGGRESHRRLARVLAKSRLYGCRRPGVSLSRTGRVHLIAAQASWSATPLCQDSPAGRLQCLPWPPVWE